MKILFFTSTGNSLYVAKRIGGELLSIPQLEKDGIYNITDDVVGIICPVYGFDVPRPVRNYLNKVTIDAKYVFTVMTYGDWSMGSVSMMEKLLAQRGINLNYSNEIDMVDNYLPMFEVSKQLEIKKDVDIENAINLVIQDITNQKNELLRKSTAKRAISSGLSVLALSSMGNKFFIRQGKRFSITQDCTNCGICQKVCPVGNIERSTQPEFLNKCEFCLACTHLCPLNAIRLKGEKSTVRFRNSNVSLKEIITANSQI